MNDRGRGPIFWTLDVIVLDRTGQYRFAIFLVHVCSAVHDLLVLKPSTCRRDGGLCLSKLGLEV